MSVLIAHLSDAHLASASDALFGRTSALARSIAAETDLNTTSIVIAFTGDAIDKGNIKGFGVAQQFLAALANEVAALSKVTPALLLIPGNHDLVIPEDASLRDLAINSLKADAVASARPQKAVEAAILDPLDAYFEFASKLGASSPSKASPYYLSVDREMDGRRLRFHLLNTAWMCTRGQNPGSLLFPINELRPPGTGEAADYEVTLLHHPFNWFKQPEVMRPLREAVQKFSDMILTGHEHSGRSLTESVHGQSTFEYREGEALQAAGADQPGGFHLLRLDFEAGKQVVTTYQWRGGEAGGAYVRTVGPVESALGRNRRRTQASLPLRPSFEERLNDPELPIQHPKAGNVKLSDIFTYPDLRRMGEKDEEERRRLAGEKLLDTITASPRILLLGSDRSGKSCLAKRLFADLNKRGHLPLLTSGPQLEHVKPEKLVYFLEGKVREQYEALAPEAYWQSTSHRRVLIVDDLHQGIRDRTRRDDLVREMERKFDSVTLIGTDEFYYEELLPVAKSDRPANALWSYDHYRILPFGYLRREQLVKTWVRLDHTASSTEFEAKSSKINTLLSNFLRNNPIPQYPWVVLIIVQSADSPEPLHAENGSYGYLLQALITAALSKSRLKLPLNGKYRWLANLAYALYTRNVGSLTDEEAREVHECYLRDYGVTDLDYKEVRDDLATAGVLRAEDGHLSFRQPYTYCYFVAWHLAQRIHAGDETARADVKTLWKDLYHEDTANVLVFLAHLTTSQVALDEMTSRAAELFADSVATDFSDDVGHINALCKNPQEFILPPGDPGHNRRALQDAQDESKARKDSEESPRRDVMIRPQSHPDASRGDNRNKMMEVVTAMRAIEILGQVLRNEATARKVESLMIITEQVFNLGRRLLGFLFHAARHQLDDMVSALEDHYRLRMPKAKEDELTVEANRHIFKLLLLAAFSVVKRVAVAVGNRHLKETFRRIFSSDKNLANRIYQLAIDLDMSGGDLPLDDAEDLSEELTGKTKGSRQRKRTYNNFAISLVNILVIDYLYLNHVPQPKVQAICKKLGIEIPTSSVDPTPKRLPPRRGDSRGKR